MKEEFGILHFTISYYRLDPAKFTEGLRTLMAMKASNDQIERFTKMVQSHNVSTFDDGVQILYQV